MAAKKVTGAGYQRQELGEKLPLDTPFALHIFPSHCCNLKCTFCPHSLPPEQLAASGFEKIIMEYTLFTKCVDDCTTFPDRLKALIFAGWGEPLTHPRIVDMVRYAKQRNIAERIEIVSNGTLLTEELSDALVNAGLDRIRISIQGVTEESYRNVAGVRINFEQFLQRLTYFYRHRKDTKVFIKTVDAALHDDITRNRFFELFEPICDEIAVEQIIPVNPDIDHSKFNTKFDKRHCGGDAAFVSVCPFPFYMSVIHPDGRYIPCCAPEFSADLGNVQQLSLKEIWDGTKMQQFRLHHLNNLRGNDPVCLQCLRPQFDLQKGDNLDPHREKILPFYEMHEN